MWSIVCIARFVVLNSNDEPSLLSRRNSQCQGTNPNLHNAVFLAFPQLNSIDTIPLLELYLAFDRRHRPRSDVSPRTDTLLAVVVRLTLHLPYQLLSKIISPITNQLDISNGGSKAPETRNLCSTRRDQGIEIVVAHVLV
jgi:hypothetical protein